MLFQVQITGEGPDGGSSGLQYAWRVQADTLQEATQLALKPPKTSNLKYDLIWPPAGKLEIYPLIP